MKRIGVLSMVLAFALCFPGFSSAQQQGPLVPLEPAPQPGMMGGMPGAPGGMLGVNPLLLRRMQEDLNRELQQIQRTLTLIGTQDKELRESLEAQRAELLVQLKGLNAQAAALEFNEIDPPNPTLPTEAADTPPTLPEPFPPSPTPVLPEGAMFPPDGGMHRLTEQGGLEPAPTIPGEQPLRSVTVSGDEAQRLLQQLRQRNAARDPSGSSDLDPSLPPETMPGGAMARVIPGRDAGVPTEPWAQRPSKEVLELQTTVGLLRREIESMRQDIKALETQIRLLNQNILLLQKQ